MSLLLAAGLLTASLAVPANATEVTPNSSKVTLNGKIVDMPAYLFKQNNYIKLRDLALLLNGTEAQFSVGWDSTSVTMTSGESYTPVGGELSALTGGTGFYSNALLKLDGNNISLFGINIANNNYFKLRDLASVLDFAVDWDSTTGTVAINTSAGYTEPAHTSAAVNTYPITMVGRTFEEISSKLRYDGVDYFQGFAAKFDYHGVPIYLGFNLTSVFDEPQADDICTYLSIPLKALINNCPASLTADQLQDLFGKVDLIESEIDEGFYSMSVNYGFFPLRMDVLSDYNNIDSEFHLFIKPVIEPGLDLPGPRVPLDPTEVKDPVIYSEYNHQWKKSGIGYASDCMELSLNHVTADSLFFSCKYYYTNNGAVTMATITDTVALSSDGKVYRPTTRVQDSWGTSYLVTFTLMPHGGVRVDFNDPIAAPDSWPRIVMPNSITCFK